MRTRIRTQFYGIAGILRSDIKLEKWTIKCKFGNFSMYYTACILFKYYDYITVLGLGTIVCSL